MKAFFLVFLLVPLIEIYFLIKVGGTLGAGLTIVLVVFTAMLGAALVRAQGFAVFTRVQMQFARGHLPAMEMLEGLLLFVAGALLLTPGFFTDAVGFAFLVPPLRRKIIRHVLAHGLFGTLGARTHPGPPPSPPRGRVIDADYEKINDEKPNGEL